MVRIKEYKFYTEGKAIAVMPAPERVYIPLLQHAGRICDKLAVKIGDPVLRGQLLATSTAKIFAPVHASISGKVSAIQDWAHPIYGQCQAIAIEGDGQDRAISEFTTKSSSEVDKLNAEQIRHLVMEAGVVGLGGAAFPTQIKLNPPNPVKDLIINLAECEPFLTSDSQLVMEKAAEILLGIKLVVRCLNAKQVYLAIEENKPEVIKLLSDKLAATDYRLRVLKSRYPQGSEKQLIKNILGKEVPQGKLPFVIGATVQNVATVYAVYEAVYKNKPLYERVVTVTGKLLEHPKNVLARVGTPIKDLIQFCGPLKEEPAKIILGGPMMGHAQYTDSVPMIKCTTGLILFDRQEARIFDEQFCIRCANCVRECPVGLMPCLINLAAEKNLWPEAKNYGALDCIECGLCNYVCPAKRRLVQSIKRAKMELIK